MGGGLFHGCRLWTETRARTKPRPLEKDETTVRNFLEGDYIRLSFAALDSKMKEGGVVTLANLQMEHSALKTLNSDIFLQLSQAMKSQREDKTEKPSEEKIQKRNLANILRARIKSNGSPS